MTRDKALAELRKIVNGIDQSELDADAGWWETSVGAAFGADRLRELEDLVTSLTIPEQAA